MGVPSRNQSQTRSRSSVAYFVLLGIAAIFVFKVDILISQTISAARRNLESKPRHLVVPSKKDRGSHLIPVVLANGTFHRNFILSWGDSRAKIIEDGELLTLSLDKSSGSGFESKKEYLFAKIDMQIKLVPGNSAGTVTTYYLSSEGSAHDEIDFEFLGNSSGSRYTLHTNIYIHGKGDREQQFFLWFDPTADFHTYSIHWNPKSILFLVDGTPIREFRNQKKLGVPFPKDRPMRLYSSLWNADNWATQGGRVKTSWDLAPFVASYRNFRANESCVWSRLTRSSSCDQIDRENSWLKEELDPKSRAEMKRMQRKYMTYNYCTDKGRFPNGPAPECGIRGTH